MDRYPAFGEALLREGIETMLAGDVDTGKAILRDAAAGVRAVSQENNGKLWVPA